MDINITKQAVSANEVVFEQTVEQAVDFDFTMPDYYPDIVRILKCKLTPQIHSKNITGDTLTIDGSALITVIYCNQSNNICSFENNFEFQKKIQVGDIDEKRLIEAQINQDYVNCRAITPRKIDVHGVLSIKAKILCTNPKEIVTDIDCEGMQLKSGTCPATNPLGFSEKVVVIEEDLELSRGSGNILSVLRSDVNTIIEQCKLIGKKAVIKGDITVNVLYCTEDGNVEKCENRIPFNQIIDMNIEGEECVVSSEVKVLSSSVKPRNNLSGESKSFSFECKLSIIAFASCENDIPVVYDAFNTKHNIEIESESITFKKLHSTVNERYMCKKNLDFSERTFGTIVDTWCENKVGQVKIINGILTLNGTSLICILAYDCDGLPQYFERSIDYEYSNTLQSELNNLIAEAEVSTASCTYTVIAEDKIEVRIELCVSARIYSVINESIITKAEIDSAPTDRAKKAPIIMYYAHSGENIWDISKEYNACCSDIMSINELEEDQLSVNKVLLIP